MYKWTDSYVLFFWVCRGFLEHCFFLGSAKRMARTFACNGLQRAMVCQPILHNIKGAGSRAVNVLGQVLPAAEAVLIMRIIGMIAKRYTQGCICCPRPQECVLHFSFGYAG